MMSRPMIKKIPHMHILTGSELIEKYGPHFCKHINISQSQYNHKYTIGLNYSSNAKPSLTFTIPQYLYYYKNCGKNIGIINIPPDATICTYGNFFSTNVLELTRVVLPRQYYSSLTHDQLVKCIVNSPEIFVEHGIVYDKLVSDVVFQNPNALKFLQAHIKTIPNDILLNAVKRNPNAIIFIPNPSIRMKLHVLFNKK